MNMFRAFMELDKLHEAVDDRNTLIANLRAIGRNYNFDKYSTAQLFRIWQKESEKHDLELEIQSDSAEDLIFCDECGLRLTDGGYCPSCDDGAEDLDEATLGWVARQPIASRSQAKPIRKRKLRYACAIEEPSGIDDPVFFYWDSDAGDYDRDDLDTALSENPYCVSKSYAEILGDAQAIKPSFSEVVIVAIDDHDQIVDCIDTDFSQEFRDFCDGSFKPSPNQIPGHLDSTLYESFLDSLTAADKISSWVSRAPVQQQQNQPNQPAYPPYKIVTIIYDVKAHKLRARANDGVHGWANVAFPNNLRNRDGQQYVVDDLVWNGKNYRASGNITAI